MRRCSLSCLGVLAATLVLATSCAAKPAAAQHAPSVVLDGHRFQVEVARTPAQHQHGLMGRTSMPADHGMLFIFRQSRPRTFWMKNTLIPLDILFFNRQRKLVTIQANAQPCKTTPCKLYPSKVPMRYALELNAGTAARIGAHKGDVIRFSNLKSPSTP
jgi:uncharacterized membrane protein (UPF0127 family)